MLRLLDSMLSGGNPSSRQVRLGPAEVMVRESTWAESAVHAPLIQAREWIQRHACDGLTVNELMEIVPMSQKTFTKRFTEEFGRTPGEEIRAVRLARAMDYLRGTDLSVERISALCGYEQQSKFSNFFKRMTDQSPSEYRKG
jgi:LacI family transcriptional regulator